jgi:hypothetical protein
MGADDWASGGHMDDSACTLSGVEEASAGVTHARLLRLLEPVTVESAAKSPPTTLVEIDARFGPEHGVVSHRATAMAEIEHNRCSAGRRPQEVVPQVRTWQPKQRPLTRRAVD